MDSEQLRALCDHLGPTAAEDMVTRAMEELAGRLCSLDDDALQADPAAFRKVLRAIRAIATQIGLVGVADVASDVITCIDDGDPIAQAATLSRLARHSEAALNLLWDLHEQEPL